MLTALRKRPQPLKGRGPQPAPASVSKELHKSMGRQVLPCSCNMTQTGCLGRRFTQRHFKDKSMDVASASLLESGIEHVAHHDSSCKSCSIQLWRRSVGRRIGNDCEVAWGCIMCLTNLILHFSDRMLVITFSATFDTWAMGHSLVFFPPFHFPGRSMPVPCPCTASHSCQCATQSANVCQQLVKHPWQVAGAELPQPPAICVQSRLFGCRSARTG